MCCGSRVGGEGKMLLDFESALVGLGRDYCRRQPKRDCPMWEFCISQRIGRSRRGDRHGSGDEKQP